jgi:hypothetical protein
MTCHPTSMFSFLTLCIASASLSACNAPSNDGAVSRVPVTSTADASLATDDIAYLTRLGLIRGHLRVGMELYGKGMHEHAKGHMKHPADELYAALTGAFEHRGSSGFAEELETLAALVQQDADDAAVQRAYATLLDRISAAESRVDSSTPDNAATQGAVAVNLLDEAAREYSIGVVDGRIEEVHEYQDAYGFTRVATDYSHRAKAANAPGEALNEDVRKVEELVRLWPELVPTSPVQGDAGRIEAVAEELATDLQTAVSAARR